jgi:hypothetical protein
LALYRVRFILPKHLHFTETQNHFAMKKLLLPCLALLPFLAVAAPAPFSVTGAIKGLKDQ